MKIKVYLLFALSVVFNIFTTQAQENIDYENIFSLKHNQVAVPKGNTLHIYSLKQGNWTITDSLVLPSNYLGLDGNIRRMYVLMEDKIVFHGFYGERKDSLYFNDTIPKPKQSHWIRTPYSTEKDFHVYENGREVAYFDDGEEWFKIDKARHVTTLSNIFAATALLEDVREETIIKMYSFNDKSGEYLCAVSDEQITFHRYEVVNEYLEAIKIDFEERVGHAYPLSEEMMFPLKDEHLTAFIYDRQMIAVVYNNLIRFYHYDFGQKQWLQNSDVPDLKL